jgi:hypothetical protein
MQLDEAFAKLGIIQDFIPVGDSNRPGTKLVPSRVTIHNTDNTGAGANAAAHAKYVKGADARKRKVSWHFTVDDVSIYQSLPTNEVGWHAGSGNGSSIGIEICMHKGMKEVPAYDRAALLTAVLARQHGITVPSSIVQHNHWTGKHCPRVLRDKPTGWQDFLNKVSDFADKLVDVSAADLSPHGDAHHDGEAGSIAMSDAHTVIASDGLRLRAGPGTSFDVRSTLPFGSEVIVLSRSGEWALIDATKDGGADGFVHSAFLRAV